MRSQPQRNPHPLQALVFQALAVNGGRVDAVALAYFLANAYVRDGQQAYRTVALDVLGYMEKQGQLRRNPDAVAFGYIAGQWVASA